MPFLVIDLSFMFFFDGINSFHKGNYRALAAVDIGCCRSPDLSSAVQQCIDAFPVEQNAANFKIGPAFF